MPQAGVSIVHHAGQIVIVGADGKPFFGFAPNAAYLLAQQLVNAIRQSNGKDELPFTTIVRLINEGKEDGQ